MDSTISFEYINYRRIIHYKIEKVNFDQFLQVLTQDNWIKANIFEKRGAKYSFLKNLSNRMRYHMRLYEIEDYLYMLVHHEPSVLADPIFHIRGFWTRFRHRGKKILNTEKLEFANYEKGREYFEELIKKYEILQKICEYEIDEDELKIFAMKYGYVSLKLPLELLIDDLKEAIDSENKMEFNLVLSKLFDIMGFGQLELNPEILLIKSLLIDNFTILVQQVKLKELDLIEYLKNIKKFSVTSVVLVPSKQDSISDELIHILEKNKLGIISSDNLFKIFSIYENAPITHEELQQIFNKVGLIDSDFIGKKLRQNDFSDILQKIMSLFKFLKNQKSWIAFKILKTEFIKTKKMSEKELKYILNFLTFPLINLVLTKLEKKNFGKNRKLYLAIKNIDEAQLRLKNIKKFLGEIALLQS